MMNVPPIQVAITNNRRRTPEEWADMAMRRIMSVGANAPEPIRLQAEAFKANIRSCIANYVRMAVEEVEAELVGKR